MTTFNRAELLTIIKGSLDGMEAKHPQERPMISIIRKAAEQLADSEPVRSKAESSADDKKAKPPTADGESKLGDLIATAGEKLFATVVRNPATIQDLLPQMREAVPSLPVGDHPAKVAITRAFLSRSLRFEKTPGEKARDPLRWYVKR